MIEFKLIKGAKMKQWTINIEETQKFLNEEYPENRYLNRTERLSENDLGRRILGLCERNHRLENR